MRKKWPGRGVPDRDEFHHGDPRYKEISYELQNFLPTTDNGINERHLR
jgi:hypothetical protein